MNSNAVGPSGAGAPETDITELAPARPEFAPFLEPFLPEYIEARKRWPRWTCGLGAWKPFWDESLLDLRLWTPGFLLRVAGLSDESLINGYGPMFREAHLHAIKNATSEPIPASLDELVLAPIPTPGKLHLPDELFDNLKDRLLLAVKDYGADLLRLHDETAMAESDREAPRTVNKEKLFGDFCAAVGLYQKHKAGKRMFLTPESLLALSEEAEDIISAIRTWGITDDQLGAVCDILGMETPEVKDTRAILLRERALTVKRLLKEIKKKVAPLEQDAADSLEQDADDSPEQDADSLEQMLAKLRVQRKGFEDLARVLAHPFLTSVELQMVIDFPSETKETAARLIAARHPANPSLETILDPIREARTSP